MTLQNYHQCRANKELMLVEGAGHCRSYFVDRTAYINGIASFFCMECFIKEGVEIIILPHG